MPVDESYSVELDLRKKGDLKLEQSATHAERLDRGLGRVKTSLSDLSSYGGRLVGVLDSAAGKVASLAKFGVLGGTTAVFGALSYGVVGLNAGFEKLKVAMGTVFSANGVAKDVPQGVTIATEQIAKMRDDAKKLPGEFKDLALIYQTGAVPALKSGMRPDEWRQMSAKAMVAAIATSVPLDQAARELTLLMEGKAGGQNTFGTRLGLTGESAEKYNKLPMMERRVALAKELDKYKGGADEFGKTFDAASSTALDGMKEVLRIGTEPLFKGVTATLLDMNNWFTRNQDRIETWARYLGNRLADAFEQGKQKFLEWWPLIQEFATVAYERLVTAWQAIAPYAEIFAKYTKEALADPNGTIDKLTTLAKLYIALKGTQFVFTLGSDVYKFMKLVGGLSASGLLAKLGMGSWGVSTLGAIGSAALPFAAAAAAPAALAGGLAYGAFGNRKSQYEWDEENRSEGKTSASAKLAKWSAAGITGTELFDKVKQESADLTAQYQPLKAEMLELEYAAFRTRETLLKLADLDVEQRVLGNRARDQQDLDDATAYAKVARLRLEGEAADKKKAADKKHPGGMNIQKVEIVITTNQNPSRIARAIVGELGKAQRMQTSSRWVPGYSGY